MRVRIRRFGELRYRLTVNLGIASETMKCGSRSHKAENEVRDWYALRVAELNAETGKLRRRNRKMATLFRDRNLRNRAKFIDAMRAFAGTRVQIRAMKEHAADPESGELESILQISLRDAGWQVETPVVNRLVEPPPAREGVHIEYPATDWFSNPALPHVAAGCNLADRLNGDSIATEIGPIHNLRITDAVIVKVGPKPSTLGMMNELKSRGNWKSWKEIIAHRPTEYERISQEEADSLRELLISADGNEERFLKFVGRAKSIEEIQKVDLKRSRQVLEEKKRYRRLI